MARERRAALLVSATLMAAVALAGCSGETRSFTRTDTVDVAPGRFAEVNLELLAGDVISWDWNADGILHFNIHTHENGAYQERVQEDNRAGEGKYTAPATGGYSFLWENRLERPIRLSYTVHGAGSIHSVV